MRTVITYGTYDLLHQGHINLLKRAKDLGDYLIVGVTSEDFDLNRGKVNVQQSLAERIQAVKDTGYADLVIPEEYFGQKIDDIRNYNVDVFTVGSDWEGYFDYLKEYCEVVYLDRTKGISSTEIREEENHISVGIVGCTSDIKKFVSESKCVSGVEVVGIYSDGSIPFSESGLKYFASYEEMLSEVDAVYVAGDPEKRYSFSKEALGAGKHVLSKSPVAFSLEEAQDLFALAGDRDLVFQEAIKTAHALAFARMLLLVKSNHIGKVRSVRATCTSLKSGDKRGALLDWGPTALLPVFDLLGCSFDEVQAVSSLAEGGEDDYTKVDFRFKDAVASIEVAKGVKSEGDLVIAGTEAYVYVPSPWWKTDYFEIRFEDFSRNKRYFYQLDGEGIRFEISNFSRTIMGNARARVIDPEITMAIADLVGGYVKKEIKVNLLG